MYQSTFLEIWEEREKTKLHCNCSLNELLRQLLQSTLNFFIGQGGMVFCIRFCEERKVCRERSLTELRGKSIVPDSKGHVCKE